MVLLSANGRKSGNGKKGIISENNPINNSHFDDSRFDGHPFNPPPLPDDLTNIPMAFDPKLDNEVRHQLIAGMDLLHADLCNYSGILKMYKIPDVSRFHRTNLKLRKEILELKGRLNRDIIANKED